MFLWWLFFKHVELTWLVSWIFDSTLHKVVHYRLYNKQRNMLYAHVIDIWYESNKKLILRGYLQYTELNYKHTSKV